MIFGKRTGKLLYIGVRNKYCAACVQNKNTQTKTDHICFKNLNGTSVCMESDIIIEGFRMAEQQHGVRYIKCTGDGDSIINRSKLSDKNGSKLLQKDILSCALQCLVVTTTVVLTIVK